MALIFLSVLQAIYIQHILDFVLPEIKLQSPKAEHLPPKEANLDANILLHLLLPWVYKTSNYNIIYA